MEDVYETAPVAPFDPYSVDLSIGPAPEAPKTELVATAVRAAIHANHTYDEPVLDSYDKFYANFKNIQSPAKLHGRLLSLATARTAEDTILGVKYGALPTQDMVNAFMANEIIQQLPDKGKSVFSSVQLPVDNALRMVEMYEKVTLGAVAAEIERRDPTLFSSALDFGGFIVLPGWTQVKTTRFKGPFPYDEFNRVYDWFYGLNLQERVANIDIPIRMLGKMADTWTDNHMGFTILANQFFNEGKAEHQADWLVDALDIATLGTFGAVKAVKGPRIQKFLANLVKVRNGVSVATEAGDPVAAGRIGVAALAGGNPQKFGLTPLQARGAADPFDFSAIDKFIPVNAAGPIGATLDTEMTRILQAASADIPVRSAKTPDQLATLEAEKLEALRDALGYMPHKAEVVESDVSGLTVRVTTYDEMALEGIGREQALEQVKEATRALEKVQEDLDNWDALPLEVKMTDEAVAANDALLVAKRNIISNLDDLEKRLARKPEDVKYEHIYYTKDDFGNYTGQLNMGWRAANVASPEKSLAPIDNTLVSNATFIELTQDAFKGKLARAMSYVTKGLKKKDRGLVDALLIHGDEIKHEFTPLELEGPITIPNVGTVTLTPKQQGAYNRARTAFKWLWGMENVIQHRIVTFNKGKWAADVNFKGSSIDGIVYREKNWPSDAKVIFTDALPKQTRYGDVVSLTDGDTASKLKQLVKEGKAEVVRFENPLLTGATSEVTHGVLVKKKLRSLPSTILPYRPGYVPMKRLVNYVVREEIKVTSNGNPSTRHVVRWMGDKEADAKDFVDKAKRADPNQELKVHLDAQLRRDDQAYRQNVSKAAFSGIFSERRLGDEIPYGPDGGKAPRISAFEGMNRYMNHIAQVFPQNEWRLGVTEMYKKTVGRAGLDLLEDPNDWRSRIKATAEATPDLERGVARLQGWLKDVLHIPDKHEMALNGLMIQLARKLEKWSIADGARRWMMSAAEEDVAQLIKGAAFHALLGWFNPRQLFVQAAGSVIAFSIEPQFALSASRRALFLRSIAYMDATDIEKWRNAVRGVAAKAAMLDPDEAEALASAYRRSGIAYSLRSNVDYKAAEGRLPIDGNALKRVTTLGLWPFREGELGFRNYSWATAYRDYLYHNPARRGKELTQTEVDQITNLSMRYTLNMMRANKAVWQKGWMGIPTQFWQVQAKFWENMLPSLFGVKTSDWDGHRWKIWTFHAMLFGSLGVPFAERWREDMLAWLTSPEGGGVTDEGMAIVVYGGITDGLLSYMLGVPFSLSEAVSIPEGALKMFDNFVADDPVNARNMFGASYSVGHRVWDAMTGPFARLVIPWKWNEVNADTLIRSASDWAAITSTWRNGTKARLWINNMAILDSQNQDKLLLLDDETKYPAAFGKALFGARTYYEIWNKDLTEVLKDDALLYKEFMDSAKYIMRLYSRDGLAPSGENLDLYNHEMNVLYNMFETEEQRLKARKAWANWVFKDESELAKNARAIQNMIKTYDNHLSAQYAISKEQKDAIAASPIMNPKFATEQNRRRVENEQGTYRPAERPNATETSE